MKTIPAEIPHLSKNRWPNFKPKELRCPCCKVEGSSLTAVDVLQALRDAVGVPLTINSAYRCIKHNRAVGGVPNSYHIKGQAFDISIKPKFLTVDKYVLYGRAKDVGFTGFGFYKTFLHVDTGKPRTWGKW